jgi:hypothetical protein
MTVDEAIDKITHAKAHDTIVTGKPLFADQKEYRDFVERHKQSDLRYENIETYRGDAYLGIDAGSTTTKLYSAASSPENTEADAWHIRNMQNRMIAVLDDSATAYIPAYIEKVVREGANFAYTLRFFGAASWTWASGDKIVPMPAGASNYTVHSTVVYGPEFCGDVALEGGGKNVSIITKPAGSSGALDPLNQRGSIAWKVRGYGASILHENYGVRLEHGVTA